MKLFLGLIFILLDIKITVGTAVVGLFPDFLGCWLVMKGLEDRAESWRHTAFGLTLFSGVLFVSDLIAKDAMARLWCQGGWLLAEIGMLALVYHLIRNRRLLRTLFPVVCCVRVLRCLVGWIPLLGTVCGVADIVMAVCFLILSRRRE